MAGFKRNPVHVSMLRSMLPRQAAYQPALCPWVAGLAAWIWIPRNIRGNSRTYPMRAYPKPRSSTSICRKQVQGFRHQSGLRKDQRGPWRSSVRDRGKSRSRVRISRQIREIKNQKIVRRGTSAALRPPARASPYSKKGARLGAFSVSRQLPQTKSRIRAESGPDRSRCRNGGKARS